MAYNEELTKRVRRLLASEPDVQERKMFGSIGFIVNGKLCIGVGTHPDHVMMVRVGIEKYDEALHKKGATPAIMRGKERKGYVFLLNEAITSERDLEYWVELALTFNKSLIIS
jgi:TfoX/Sxy family transcriptional regulator of competence genes